MQCNAVEVLSVGLQCGVAVWCGSLVAASGSAKTLKYSGTEAEE